MLLTQEQVMSIWQQEPLASAFKDVPLYAGGPVGDENGENRLISTFSVEDDFVLFEILGPCDEAYIDSIVAISEPWVEGFEVDIDSKKHTLALFARCCRKKESGRSIHLTFELNPFA